MLIAVSPDDVDALIEIQSVCNGEDESKGVGVISRLCGARGKAYAMLDNTSLALTMYKTAVRIDVRNLKAWDELTGGNFMSVGDTEVRGGKDDGRVII